MIHEPKLYQEELECGCMVVLRYWQLFRGKLYNLKGNESRARVLKYYNVNNSMLVEGTLEAVFRSKKRFTLF